uniref:CXXC-type zinc finger protein 1 n=1 Tax=Panagrolaimus sp. JU765 TaxID=591449 RepID=A0AC34RJ57_9BILA
MAGGKRKASGYKKKYSSSEDEQNGCPCGSSRGSKYWICCDGCETWYHGKCAGLMEKETTMIDKWFCHHCITTNSSFKITYKSTSTTKKPKPEPENSFLAAAAATPTPYSYISHFESDIARERYAQALEGSTSSYEQQPAKGLPIFLPKKVEPCNNCSGCFRSLNCEMCIHCHEKRGTCVKRICIRALEGTLKEQREIENHRSAMEKGLEKLKKKESTALYGKKAVQPRLRDIVIFSIFQINMARKRKDESGVASATVQLSKESKQDRINRKLKKVKAKKNENKKPGRPKKLKIQDIEVVFSTITREPDNDAEIVHCQGPQCRKPSRPGSKYCSHFCGLEQARRRLLMVLPVRLQDYANPTPSNVQMYKQVIEETTTEHKKCRENLEHLSKIKKCVVDHIDRVAALSPEDIEKEKEVINARDPDKKEDDPLKQNTFFGRCTVCGATQSSYGALQKHIMRCFMRIEKRTEFCGPDPEPENPENIICDAFCKQQNAFCKRLRLLCPDHYKGSLTEKLTVCAAPLFMYRDGFTFDFTNEIPNLEEMFNGGYCTRKKEECDRHHAWAQMFLGSIDNFRISLLNHMEEATEKYRKARRQYYKKFDVLDIMTNYRITDKTDKFGMPKDVDFINDTPAYFNTKRDWTKEIKEIEDRVQERLKKRFEEAEKKKEEEKAKKEAAKKARAAKKKPVKKKVSAVAARKAAAAKKVAAEEKLKEVAQLNAEPGPSTLPAA